MKEDLTNIAFVDGQNLHLGTRETGWSIDHKKFRTYLTDKYKFFVFYFFFFFFFFFFFLFNPTFQFFGIINT